MAALSIFSFAPQRFSSRDRPLSRFVLLSKSVLEASCLEVVCPTSTDRKKWAQQILRDLDTSAWLLIGMLADLADDCTRFVRKLDERRSDPVEFCDNLEAFRVHIKKEYIQGRMWLRSDTYTERMVAFLAATSVVQFGKQCAVLGKPSAQESRLCQAHVANVADGILKYIKGEFPDFCAQAHFVCFRLHQPQPHRLQELLVVLGWDGGTAARCVQQYNAVWPRAIAVKQQKQLPDTDCWVCAFAEVCPCEHTELRDILGVVVSFLVSETECERNFSVERRQFEHRPRLSASLRSAGLKVMVDGVPLKDLQCDGVPRGDFFPVVQNRYAERRLHQINVEQWFLCFGFVLCQCSSSHVLYSFNVFGVLLAGSYSALVCHVSCMLLWPRVVSAALLFHGLPIQPFRWTDCFIGKLLYHVCVPGFMMSRLFSCFCRLAAPRRCRSTGPAFYHIVMPPCFAIVVLQSEPLLDIVLMQV